MDRSLKLKLLAPKDFAAAKEAYEGGASARKPQCPTNDGGCMAANGDEASIMVLDEVCIQIHSLSASTRARPHRLSARSRAWGEVEFASRPRGYHKDMQMQDLWNGLDESRDPRFLAGLCRQRLLGGGRVDS